MANDQSQSRDELSARDKWIEIVGKTPEQSAPGTFMHFELGWNARRAPDVDTLETPAEKGLVLSTAEKLLKNAGEDEQVLIADLKKAHARIAELERRASEPQRRLVNMNGDTVELREGKFYFNGTHEVPNPQSAEESVPPVFASEAERVELMGLEPQPLHGEFQSGQIPKYVIESWAQSQPPCDPSQPGHICRMCDGSPKAINTPQPLASEPVCHECLKQESKCKGHGDRSQASDEAFEKALTEWFKTGYDPHDNSTIANWVRDYGRRESAAEIEALKQDVADMRKGLDLAHKDMWGAYDEVASMKAELANREKPPEGFDEEWWKFKSNETLMREQESLWHKLDFALRRNDSKSHLQVAEWAIRETQRASHLQTESESTKRRGPMSENERAQLAPFLSEEEKHRMNVQGQGGLGDSSQR